MAGAFTFTSEIIEWRGPAPFYFIPTPAKFAPEIKAIAAEKSYGWGVVHAIVTINHESFKTALFPKQGSYLIPLKLAIRKPLGLELGDKVKVNLDFNC